VDVNPSKNGQNRITRRDFGAEYLLWTKLLFDKKNNDRFFKNLHLKFIHSN